MPDLKSLALVFSTFILSLFPTTKNHISHTKNHLTPTPSYAFISTPTPQQESLDTNTVFIYPGASVVSNGGNTIILRSTDNPTTITDWYKSLFSRSNMNDVVINIVTTNNILDNKLAGNTASTHIAIDIYDEAGNDTSTITVVLSGAPKPQVQSESIDTESNIVNITNSY